MSEKISLDSSESITQMLKGSGKIKTLEVW